MRLVVALAVAVLLAACGAPARTSAGTVGTVTSAVGSVWTPAPRPDVCQAGVCPTRGAWFTLDRTALGRLLDAAPARTLTADQPSVRLEVPDPGGRLRAFAVHLAPVVEPSLAAAHPEIRTLAGQGVDDPSTTVALDLTPLGFHASVRGGDAWSVDPSGQGTYVAYRAADLPVPSLSPTSEGPVRR